MVPDSEKGSKELAVTEADILKFQTSYPNPKASDFYELENVFRQHEDRLKGVGAEPFGPDGKVDPTAVAQGEIGDCYFLASLVGLANTRPEEVKKFITVNKGSGDLPDTYTVNFPGNKRTVTVEGLSEEMLYAGKIATSGGHTWVPILEEAFAQLKGGGASKGKEGKYGPISGDLPRAGIKLLTGHKSKAVLPKLVSRKNLLAMMLAGIQSKAIVLCTTAPKWLKRFKVLPGNHVFTVMDCSADGSKITVKNPWGAHIEDAEIVDEKGALETKADGVYDGIFELTLEDFVKCFDLVTIEKIPDLK
ncbi:MAG: hypothetical protein ACI9MR_004271 [Myxococcota bacterium]